MDDNHPKIEHFSFINLAIQPKVILFAEQNFVVNIGIGDHLILDPLIELATHWMVLHLQFLQHLDIVSAQTKTLTQNHKMDGHSHNCCARVRVDSFGSSLITCSQQQ